jgi:hypothetical protein
MSIIIYIVLAFSLMLVVLPFFNINLAVAFYLAYMILVPYLQIKIGITLSYNLINILFLAVFFFQYKKYDISLDFTTMKPFLFLYIALLLLTLFEWATPWEFQLNRWRTSFMRTCIIPFILWNMSLKDVKMLKYIQWALIISTFIACTYGVFLMQLEGANPYTSYLVDYFGIDYDAAKVYEETDNARLDFSTAAKIQSTFEHPMTWCLFLCFIMLVFYSFVSKKGIDNRWLYWSLLAFVGFNILISGVRTGIATMAIAFFYYMLQKRNWKIFAFTFIAAIIAFFVIESNESLSNLFSSFTDVTGKKSEVKGSSITMRLNQLQGAFDEIEDHLLVGKGYNWSNSYLAVNEVHPVLLGFESLIFIVLCNHGLVGIGIWVTFFILLFRTQRKMELSRDDVLLMDCMVIIFFSYAILTGEYGYLSFFAAYYVFLMSWLIHSESEQLVEDE